MNDQWTDMERRVEDWREYADDPVPASVIEPEKFADLAYDLHPDNFGSYDGRVVLIDYT